MSTARPSGHHPNKHRDWRRDSLRSTLWVVPSALVAAVSALFLGTYAIDRAAHYGSISLPTWVNSGSADAGRQVLIGLAAATITVAGVVFSITIVALTLASQQFGPRMLRNFIRDRGTQFALGLFVATFVYDVLALGSITSQRPTTSYLISRSQWRSRLSSETSSSSSTSSITSPNPSNFPK